ncbi:hypothetical protein QE320_gp133 [Pseudomonas phage EM]|uniref:Uncharacterized protein n=1 Tax=Pseudomonas phage EM TaxID=2936914 RepID=A0AAE9HKC2_9CAUD|nr:hypothetical protein QE320_gp133 [Pseudomonas phage EM]UPW35921.1 hypothetical protein EM_136 [Pseudomonas phage EM]
MTLAFIVWLTMAVFPGLKTIGLTAFWILLVMAAGIACALPILLDERFTPSRVQQGFIKHGKRLAIILITVAVVGQLVPNEKTSWIMIGAYATQALYESDTGQIAIEGANDMLRRLIKRANDETKDVLADKLIEQAKEG